MQFASMPTPVSSLNIPLRPSRTLRWIWIVCAAVVFAVLVLLPMDWRFRLLLLVAWSVLALRLKEQWRRLCGVQMVHVTERGLGITTASGREEVELFRAPYVTYPLMILPLQTGRRRLSLICLPDSGDQDDLRRLRVWLSLRGGK